MATEAGEPADRETMDASTPDVRPLARDAEIRIVQHDAGGNEPCTSTCDCAQGLACVSGVCRVLGTPVYCCQNPGCPSGQSCLDRMDRPGTCPSPPDAGPDAGPRDVGPGGIGAFCEADGECDQTLGYTCWERFEPPFVWGYCTLENCAPACPTGSTCIQFNIPPPEGPVTGCMATCLVDADCREDAYCLAIPTAGLSICVPDCRDDLLDCAPRDGTAYCSRTSGLCEPTPGQTSGVSVGDPCVDNTDCGIGQVCMGEIGWLFPGGMCTRVCSGLPESMLCSAGETCQLLAGVGLCFRDCVAGACPTRANAVCGELDPTWMTPSCVPQ